MYPTSLILAWISESMTPQRRRCIVTAKQAAVKKYIVQLSDDERERLNTLIHKGKHRAGQLVKSRILLKADASEAGEGWSDSEIAAALDTCVTTVARTRQQRVEEGFESVPIRKHSPVFSQTAHLRWSIRGQANRPGLFRPAQVPRSVDAAAAGIRGRGAEHY